MDLANRRGHGCLTPPPPFTWGGGDDLMRFYKYELFLDSFYHLFLNIYSHLCVIFADEIIEANYYFYLNMYSLFFSFSFLMLFNNDYP